MRCFLDNCNKFWIKIISFQMGTLPTLPFKVGMNIQKWAEKKADQLQHPSLQNVVKTGLDFCTTHPYVGGFAILASAISLGPLSLLIGFLVVTNCCLLVGGFLVELVILGTAVSIFLPIFMFTCSVSFFITTIFGTLSFIFGNNVRIPKLKAKERAQKMTEPVAENIKGTYDYLDMELLKEDEVESKMTQTYDWVDQTGNEIKGDFCDQIVGKVSIQNSETSDKQ